jgi:transposase
MLKRWHMYNSIHSLKNQGFSKRQVAERLGINFRTVSKYLSMTPEEFNEKTLNRERRRNLVLYEGVVVDWLKRYPDMSAAQVLDWLKEHYQVIVAERTVRRFVEKLRSKYSVPKVKGNDRQYEAIEDPPMGQQMQVDFGIAWVFDFYKRSHRKLYCMAAVLSHSRYKWGFWYAQPPTAIQFTQALQACFEHMGGMPKEIVFDQDGLLAVDEITVMLSTPESLSSSGYPVVSKYIFVEEPIRKARAESKQWSSTSRGILQRIGKLSA